MHFAPQHFQQSTPAIAWHLTLMYGDIVSYRFPTDESAPHKARPCLVLDILRHRGKRYALLAYGTTSRSTFNAGLEVRLLHPDSATSAGLDRPTRFVGMRRITVPLGCNRFVPHPVLGTPVLGRLAGGHYATVLLIRAKLREDAAEARRQKRADTLATA